MAELQKVYIILVYSQSKVINFFSHILEFFHVVIFWFLKVETKFKGEF